MMRVDKVEDDRPGIWHCKSVFENRSSFVVTLSGVTVWLSGRDDPIPVSYTHLTLPTILLV